MIVPPALLVECWLAPARIFGREVRHITDTGFPSRRICDPFLH